MRKNRRFNEGIFYQLLQNGLFEWLMAAEYRTGELPSLAVVFRPFDADHK
jgi:hypothetical protein